MKKRKKENLCWLELVSVQAGTMVRVSKLGGSAETRDGPSLKMPRTSSPTHPQPGSAQRDQGEPAKTRNIA